jgi:signal recognition particle subunit SRP14
LSETEQKTEDPADALSDLHPRDPMPIIIKASNGKSKRNRSEKVKISTIVQPKDLDGFYVRYADICKSGMAALKPRDRSKKKAKARKKKTTS